MADVKWIKIVTDIFDDEKILLIESMPERDSIIVIWFKLLCMAGKQNNGGVLTINDKIAYTDEMLATIFRRPLNTVRMALKTFETYGMIEIVDSVITIPNWEKHQNIEQLDKMREKNRQRVAAYRNKQKQKLLNDTSSNDDCNITGNVTDNVTVTLCNDIEKIREDKNRIDKIYYRQIIDLYNDICISFPKVKTISDNRKKAIRARLNTYSYEQFKELFETAEASSFLKGNNSRNWQANFDWLIKDNNFAKVLEGNYTDKQKSVPNQQYVEGVDYF